MTPLFPKMPVSAVVMSPPLGEKVQSLYLEFPSAPKSAPTPALRTKPVL